jgi:Family of unknown function (DUF5678)
MTETSERQVRIAGHVFLLRSHDVRRVLRQLQPEPIASHFVVVDERRFPPKQVISAVTGLDRADFTTHQARRTLMRLGFVAGRLVPRAAAPRSSVGAELPSSADSAAETLSARLRPLVGQWVAIIDDEVVHAADTPQQLVGWLSRHGQTADSVFRVPEDEVAATGLAPL